jgi:hypothetical protein
MLARSLSISCFTLATSSAFAGSASSAGCRSAPSPGAGRRSRASRHAGRVWARTAPGESSRAGTGGSGDGDRGRRPATEGRGDATAGRSPGCGRRSAAGVRVRRIRTQAQLRGRCRQPPRGGARLGRARCRREGHGQSLDRTASRRRTARRRPVSACPDDRGAASARPQRQDRHATRVTRDADAADAGA